MKIWSILFLLALSLSNNAQDSTDISFWSDVMMNANSPEHRQLAFEKFESEFSKIVEEGDAFQFDFKKTPELTVISDSLELNDAFSQLEDLEYISLDHNEWLGGIYYNMVQMGRKYYVFSYRQLDNYTKFKSFDVLSFADDGSPVLGEESFVYPSKETRDIVKSRVTFKYSVDAILSLNYNVAIPMMRHLDQIKYLANRVKMFSDEIGKIECNITHKGEK